MSAAPVDVLGVLREHYPFDVPEPRADLAARMDAGIVGMALTAAPVDGDELAERRRRQVALPMVTGRHGRVRTAVAALVAAVVLVIGLGAAGALPDSLQRHVASAFSHLGIELPSPSGSHHGSGSKTTPSTSGTPTIGTSATSGTTRSSSAVGSSSTSNTSVPSTSGAGSSGSNFVPTTTVPGSLPPAPDVTVPPVTVPSSPTLPPVTVPQPPLPPVTAPSAGAPTPPDSGSTAPPPPLPPLPVSLSLSVG